MSLLWRLALRNIFRNRRRTIATVFTICFGYVGLVLTGGYIIYVERSVRALQVYINHGGEIAIYKKDALNEFFSKPRAYQIDLGLSKDIQSVLGRYPDQIEKIGFYLTGMGLLSNGVRSTPVLIQGLDPKLDQFTRSHPMIRAYLPNYFKDQGAQNFGTRASQDYQVISITNGLAELISRPGVLSELPESEKVVQLAAKTMIGDFNAINATLGPTHSTGFPYLEDLSVVTSLKAAQELFATEGVTNVNLFLKDKVSTAEFLEKLQKDFAQKKIPVELFPFYTDDVGMFYSGTMGFMFSLGFSFFVLILGAVALSVVNTISIGIIERSREIGTLRAIGFRPRDLSELFFKENLIISIFCIFVGIFLAQGLAGLINAADVRLRPAGVANDLPFFILPELWMALSVAIPLIFLTCITAYGVASRKTRQPLILLLTDPGA